MKTEEKNGGIIVSKQKNNFSIIPNHVLNDKRLSFKSRGILSYLLSKPDGWTVQLKDLYNNSIDGVDAIRSGLNELLLTGYSEIHPNIKGGRVKYIFDIPLFSNGYRLMENKNKKYIDGEILINESPLTKKKGEMK